MSELAYLGDARIGDRISFRLPADSRGATTEHEGVVQLFKREGHATGVAMITFRMSGADSARVFACRPDLHIEIGDRA